MEKDYQDAWDEVSESLENLGVLLAELSANIEKVKTRVAASLEEEIEN